MEEYFDSVVLHCVCKHRGGDGRRPATKTCCFPFMSLLAAASLFLPVCFLPFQLIFIFLFLNLQVFVSYGRTLQRPDGLSPLLHESAKLLGCLSCIMMFKLSKHKQ